MNMQIDLQSFGSLLKKVVDNRGKTCPVTADGIPLIATNCIVNSHLHPQYEKVRYVSAETYNNWFRGHPEPGDMIFVLKGTPGRVAWVPDPVGFCIAQDMVAIRADERKIYPKYLFAVLRSSAIQQEIDGLHVGSLIPHFKKGDFDDLQIPCLAPDIQKYIGDQYFDISLKIDLLHRQNKTLEAMAETMFRQWFVEEAQADWHEFKLGDIATTVNGFNHTQEQLSNSGDYLLSMGSVVKSYGISMNGTRHVNADDVPEKYLCNVGDIVITTRDVTQNADLLGSPGIIPSYFAKARVVVGSNLYKLDLQENGIGRAVVYEALRAGRYREFVKEVASGTSILMLKKSDLMEYKFNVPPAGKMREVGAQLATIHKKLDVNYGSILLYEKLRDTLLPKLMSGEIRIQNA